MEAIRIRINVARAIKLLMFDGSRICVPTTCGKIKIIGTRVLGYKTFCRYFRRTIATTAVHDVLYVYVYDRNLVQETDRRRLPSLPTSLLLPLCVGIVSSARTMQISDAYYMQHIFLSNSFNMQMSSRKKNELCKLSSIFLKYINGVPWRRHAAACKFVARLKSFTPEERNCGEKSRRCCVNYTDAVRSRTWWKLRV